MENYIVIASYVDIYAEEDEPNLVDHFTKVLGRTDDPEEMRAMAREAFKQVIEEDYEVLQSVEGCSEELRDDHKAGFQIVLNDEIDIKMMLDLSTDQGGDVERSGIIGSLYHHNKKYGYAQHMLVTAFKERKEELT